jgi:hypothetical protein
MTTVREVQTCTRCRSAKRRCDKVRPTCSRCEKAGTTCTYEGQATEASPSPDGQYEGAADGTMISNPNRVVQKRVRACLSCTRCHRLKIKCDKQSPCGRCARSGYETTCIYTHNANTADTPSPIPSLILTDEDPEFVVASWFLRRRGSSHFKALLNRVRLFCFHLVVSCSC